MTGFYHLVDTKPCAVQVNGAFQQGSQGTATHSELLQLGQLHFENTLFLSVDFSFIGTVGCTGVFYEN